MRTTIDIDSVVLGELRERARREDKSVGRLASELLAVALRRDTQVEAVLPGWLSRPMGQIAELDDPEAVRLAMDMRGHSG